MPAVARDGVAGNRVVAGFVKVDAVIAVVTDGVAAYAVVAGIAKGDAVPAVARDGVAGNSVVAGFVKVDAVIVVAADVIAGNGAVVAGILEGDAALVVRADVVRYITVIRRIKIYSRLYPTSRPSHRKPAYIHIICKYPKHIVYSIFRINNTIS